MNTMLATAQSSIRREAEAMGYEPKIIEEFLRPEHVHSFTIRVKGNEYPAYRVQHNSKLGPHKGGVRFHPAVTLDEVQALATLMSLKTAAAGLPLGGGKGGVAVDPRTLDPADVEAIARDYGRQLAPHIGSNADVPGPDVNTGEQSMDWMLAGYEEAAGKTDPGCFTGKSIATGGSEGRPSATGRGAAIVLREYLQAKGLIDTPLTLALQGFGNAGYYFAASLPEFCPNVRLVAIANSKHTWLAADGIDIAKTDVSGRTPRPEELSDVRGAKELPSEAIIGADVDILALAALEDAVTQANVDSVRAKHVIEIANGPITLQADDVLVARGVAVLPDFIANAGGVIVSCLEWQQNLANEHWAEERVHAELEKAIVAAAQSMLDRATKEHLTYRQAALRNALTRILG